MVNKFRNYFRRRNPSLSLPPGIQQQMGVIQQEMAGIKVLQGSIAATQNNCREIKKLQDAEFKVFSQWGDDGIIQFLINRISLPHKTFIEFGVENYQESNTRFLLLNNNWSGMVIDGSKENIDFIKRSGYSWRHDLIAIAEFITAENINSLLRFPNFDEEVGILSIDIDGNDYWVWKSITSIRPIIVIIEYNSVFGSGNPWSIPYDKDFVRNTKHYSNLYYGTSLRSIVNLSVEKGYSFIGCNSAGNNAYFIRNDYVGDLPVISPELGYVESKFMESRDESGNLSYLKGSERLNKLKGLSVYNTETNKLEIIS